MINLEKKALLVNRQIPHNLKSQLEQDYLPAYLVQRRWFAGKNQKCPELKITDVFPTSVDGGPILMVFETVGDRPQSYFMPIGFKHTAIKPAVFICEIKLGSLLGYLVDALEDDELLQQLVSNLESAADDGSEIDIGLCLERNPGFPSKGVRTIKRFGAEQSNSSIRFGDVILKAYRRLQPGQQPELELGRFLSGAGNYINAPRVVGSLEIRASEPVTLCLFQEVIENIGDAWKVTCGLLGRLAEHPASSEAHSQLMELADRLGDRTARLHNSLGSGAAAEFSSEPIRAEDAASWVHDICVSATRVLDQLADHPGPLSRRLVARREDVIAEIRELSSLHVQGRKIRLHGDLHLGQVLVTTDDVYIIDFEGEPLRSFEQRREKFSPMKDVAGLLRSFDYARAATDRHAVSITGADIAGTVEEAKRTLWKKYILLAPALVGDLTEAKKLLRIFLYEKTFYEIEYELANRPDWVDIPVSDALALLDEDIALHRDDGIMVW